MLQALRRVSGARRYVCCNGVFMKGVNVDLSGSQSTTRPIFKSNSNNHRSGFAIHKYALGLFAGALSMFGFEEEEEKKDSKLVNLIKRGILLVQKEEYNKAEQMFHLALKLAQEQNHFDGVTFIYDSLANLAYDMEDFKKAEKLFITVMQRLLLQNVDTADNKMTEISLKLAIIYRHLSDFEKAEEGFKWCLSNVEKRINEHNDRSEDTVALKGMILDEQATLYYYQRKYKEALALKKEAYSIALDVYGKVHEQIFVLLCDLGSISNNLGNPENAIEYFLEAITIGRSVQIDELLLAGTYVNLANVYLVKEMLDKAEMACKSARILTLRNNDPKTKEEIEKCFDSIREKYENA